MYNRRMEVYKLHKTLVTSDEQATVDTGAHLHELIMQHSFW